MIDPRTHGVLESPRTSRAPLRGRRGDHRESATRSGCIVCAPRSEAGGMATVFLRPIRAEGRGFIATWP